jgi:GDPmannose 4,6-dehydratase
VGKPVVFVDPRYFRPTEVETLLGNPAKARNKLGWSSEIPFDELVREMVECDLNEAVRESICRQSGFPLKASCEANM